MKITICETAGLCAGAMRAYMSVVDSLKTNKNVAVYKEILHNENLISDLKNKGAIFHDNLSEFKKDDFVILRAHGEEKSIYEYLEKNGNRYFDSICHNVKNVRDISIKKEKEGFNIIVVGKCKNGKYHDEVLGLVSFLTNPIVVSSIDEAQRIHFEQGKSILQYVKQHILQSCLKKL